MAQPMLSFTDSAATQSAIETAAKAVKMEVATFPGVDDLPLSESALATLESGKNDPGEPLHGRDGAIFAALVARQPSILFFDLDNPALRWKHWAALIKSSPATRRTPIIAFAETVDADVRYQTKNVGIEVAVPHERFLSDIPKLIHKYVKVIDPVALQSACEEPLSTLAIKGLELFNQGEYYDCHEELEHAWNEDKGPARELYRGVLQVAVAYLQIERQNYNGAVKMLMRVKQWLDPLPDVCRTIHVAQLRRDAESVYETLQTLGRERISEFDFTTLQPVIYEESA